MPVYDERQRQKLLKTMLRPIEARRKGLKKLRGGKITFDLTDVGMCGRYVRQAFEAMLGKGEKEWLWGAKDANAMGDKLFRSGLALPEGTPLQAGDILVWHFAPHGHIVIYEGDEVYHDGRRLVCENTIAQRGDPRAAGTKETSLKSVHGGQGYTAFRLFPTVASK